MQEYCIIFIFIYETLTYILITISCNYLLQNLSGILLTRLHISSIGGGATAAMTSGMEGAAVVGCTVFP
jgi:hypothetical protein